MTNPGKDFAKWFGKIKHPQINWPDGWAFTHYTKAMRKAWDAGRKYQKELAAQQEEEFEQWLNYEIERQMEKND